MSRQNQSRAVQTRFPEKPRASVMAAPVRKVVSLTRIDYSGWRRVEGSDPCREECTLTAHFSDGGTHEERLAIEYAHGERERLFEAMADVSKATDEVVEIARRLMARRQTAVADAYASLQRRFGKPFVRETAA